MLWGCSSSPSLIVTPPVIDTPELIVKPSVAITTPCDPLIQYVTDDFRDMIKVTIQNNNRYFLCASKMRSAIIFINSN